MGPSYACLFMGYFKYTLLQQYKKLVPETYKRYINDGSGTTSIKQNNPFQPVSPLTKLIVLNSDSLKQSNHTLTTSCYPKYPDVPEHSALAKNVDNTMRTSCLHNHSSNALSEDSTNTTSHHPGHKLVHCIPLDLPLLTVEIPVLSQG